VKLSRKEQLARAKFVRQRRVDDVRLLMSEGAGRRVLWQLIDGTCGTFGGSYSGDALASAYREGRRSVGIEVMQELQRLAPEAYVLMLQERLKDALGEPEQEPIEDPDE
jgi:hypothetical protein